MVRTKPATNGLEIHSQPHVVHPSEAFLPSNFSGSFKPIQHPPRILHNSTDVPRIDLWYQSSKSCWTKGKNYTIGDRYLNGTINPLIELTVEQT